MSCQAARVLAQLIDEQSEVFAAFAKQAQEELDVDPDAYAAETRLAGRRVIEAYECKLLDDLHLGDAVERLGREASEPSGADERRPGPETLFVMLAGGYQIPIWDRPRRVVLEIDDPDNDNLRELVIRPRRAVLESTGGLLSEQFPSAFDDGGPPKPMPRSGSRTASCRASEWTYQDAQYRAACHRREAAACRVLASVIRGTFHQSAAMLNKGAIGQEAPQQEQPSAEFIQRPPQSGWTKKDLVEKADIADNTFSSIRKAAGVAAAPTGRKGHDHRFTPDEVRQMIEAAREGSFQQRTRDAVDKGWSELLAKVEGQ